MRRQRSPQIGPACASYAYPSGAFWAEGADGRPMVSNYRTSSRRKRWFLKIRFPIAKSKRRRSSGRQVKAMNARGKTRLARAEFRRRRARATARPVFSESYAVLIDRSRAPPPILRRNSSNYRTFTRGAVVSICGETRHSLGTVPFNAALKHQSSGSGNDPCLDEESAFR